MAIPDHPKLYHIVHVDRLPSIVGDGRLMSDALMRTKAGAGTTIGMSQIKRRRLGLALATRPGLHVGDCVPFYFCPRSIMLYLIHCANHPDLAYRDGQAPVVHLELDLHETVRWAQRSGKRWAFTLSNAGASYFEDHCDLAALAEINWAAVAADRWSGAGIDPSVKEGKQAEFLVENAVAWELVQRIGVAGASAVHQVSEAMRGCGHRPLLEIMREWYY